MLTLLGRSPVVQPKPGYSQFIPTGPISTCSEMLLNWSDMTYQIVHLLT